MAGQVVVSSSVPEPLSPNRLRTARLSPNRHDSQAGIHREVTDNPTFQAAHRSLHYHLVRVGGFRPCGMDSIVNMIRQPGLGAGRDDPVSFASCPKTSSSRKWIVRTPLPGIASRPCLKDE
jgi:hypothetical protein